MTPLDPPYCPPPTLCDPPSLQACLCSYYKGVRQMVQVSDQDMNTHLAEISRVRGRGFAWPLPLPKIE